MVVWRGHVLREFTYDARLPFDVYTFVCWVVLLSVMPHRPMLGKMAHMQIIVTVIQGIIIRLSYNPWPGYYQTLATIPARGTTRLWLLSLPRVPPDFGYHPCWGYYQTLATIPANGTIRLQEGLNFSPFSLRF